MSTKDPERAADLATSVLIEIRDELKTHSAELKSHSAQFAGIRKELEGHSAQFVEIRKELHSQGERLDRHEKLLAEQSTTLNQVLRAVEHGNDWRDGRVHGLEQRVARLEQHTGLDT